jgi:GAF domain-containing protein
MAALAFDRFITRRFFVRLNAAPGELADDFTLALETARSRTNAEVAVLYDFDPDAYEFNGVARDADAPARIPDCGLTLTEEATRWLRDLATPAQSHPRHDPLFESFPEAIQHGLARLLVIPLRSDREFLGLLTLGRLHDRAFERVEVENAERAGRLLGAVLERQSLRRQLAERKVVERAKGILQRVYRMSEEKAYLMLRDSSRRRRLTMAEVAQEIIESQVDRRRQTVTKSSDPLLSLPAGSSL